MAIVPFDDLWQATELPGRGTAIACDLPGPTPDAPTVVLLHGLSATGAVNWGPCLPVLSRTFRVLALDHRGHGRGIRAETPFTLEDCADDAVALVDAVGARDAIFVGYSMGGPIAQLVWRRHPDRVRGLVLCATAGDFRFTQRRLLIRLGEEFARASSLVPGVVRRRGVRSVLGGLVTDDDQRRQLAEALADHDPRAVGEAARAVDRFSSMGWLGDVAVPATVVVTTRDRFVPPQRQLELAAAIPGATVVPLDAAHLAFCTRPDAFADAIVEACRSVIARTPGAPVTARRRRTRWWQRVPTTWKGR